MWYKIKANSVEIRIFAKPNAKKTLLVKIAEDALHIAIHAKPQEGEANKALIEYIAKLFAVPKSTICLLRGETGRHKQLLLPLTANVTQRLHDPEGLLHK